MYNISVNIFNVHKTLKNLTDPKSLHGSAFKTNILKMIVVFSFFLLL